jgi:dipeptidyl aminopeptidase/acylaminoacyl peptidase
MLGSARRALRGSFLLLLAAALPATAQQLPTLTPADYGRFENLGAGTLSPDGRWLAVQISRVDEDGELQIYNTATGEKRVVANGLNARFSKDGRWLAYSIGLPQREREQRERARQPVRSRIGVVDLRSGVERITDNIASFEFSGDGRFLAMRGYAPAAAPAASGAPAPAAAGGGAGAANGAASRAGRGVNVLVRDLANGTDTNFGNVAEYGWQSNGSMLALVVDADNRVGNGVQLFDAGRGVLRTLTSDTASFGGIVWRKDADDLAVHREIRDDARDNESHVVHAWTGLAGRAPVMHTFDPRARGDFPLETRVVSYRPIQWADGGSTLFFGLREWPAKAARDTTAESDRPGVEIWHARDVDVIPEQRVRSEINRRRNALAAWHLPNNRLVEIASDPDLNVTLAQGQRLALGVDGRPYDRERMFGPAYSDLYTIDVATGERTLFQQRVQFQYGASPGGRYALYLRDGHYWAYDVNRRTHTNLTQNVPTSFINLDNDHTIQEKPPYGIAGWTPGDRTVLIYDKFDVWEVRPDGSGATRLTNGAAGQIRHRVVRLDFEEPVIDLAKPTFVALYGERSKQYGYGRLTRNGSQQLVLLDKNVSRLAKADNADVYVFVTQTFSESPNYHVAGPTLANARRLTDTNPFMGEYAWSPRSELVDFTNERGQQLQAALHYPANYDPSKQYPMIVYYYEITSNQIHSFGTPSERAGYSPTVWTQEGYFVLRPDITYRDRNPGISAQESVIPAVDAALARVNVDPARVGITGHSWGGYQTAFLATVSDRFAAAVAGAPLTEMYGMYLSMYWNTGSTDARIFEISQGRMEVPPWEDLDSYMANSPVHQIRNMRTPLLVAFGDKDGAVDWQQGVMMYNAARRENKDFVLLVYPGENHSLARRPNQIDYHRRSLEWFGHYLKGEPAPDWMTQGVRHGTPDLRPPRATPAITTTTTTDASETTAPTSR